jgi:lycopene cyclase domain-containing protein
MEFPEKFTYLAINIGVLLFPLLLSFDRKVSFYKHWKHVFFSSAIIGFVFLFWDIFFTSLGVWGFTDKYLVGITLINLPIEEWLFFVTVPYSCLFVYECVKVYLNRIPVKRNWSLIYLFLGVFFLTNSFLFNEHVYTCVANLTAGVTLVSQYYFKILSNRKAFLFLLSYLICMLPFFIVNGKLTSLPVVWYHVDGIWGIRLFGCIPLEDTIYNLGLFLGITLVYEKLNKNKASV